MGICTERVTKPDPLIDLEADRKKGPLSLMKSSPIDDEMTY